MKALQWDGSVLRLNDVPAPERRDGEALVKVTRAGICNTDLEILRGYHGFTGTIGHEFTGVVSQADDASLKGQRIVSDINCACGDCIMCRKARPHHCLNRHTIGIVDKDGAFAEYLTCPVANLVCVPDHVPDDCAVFAEPLAAALEILEQVDCSDIEEAAVIGDGKLGLLITLCLTAGGVPVTLVGHHPESHALIASSGAGFSPEPPDRKFPLVVEATGNPRGFEDALGLTEATGTLVLKSTYAGGFDFNPAALVVNEITLLGSRCGPMPKAVELLASGGLDPRPLIAARYPLEHGLEAVEHARHKGVLKVLLEP